MASPGAGSWRLMRVQVLNEPKSARYHRLKRQAGFVSLGGTIMLLAGMLYARPELTLTVYLIVLVVLNELITFPIAYYRSYHLEHRYELSAEPLSVWLRDHVKALALGLAFTIAAAHGLYFLIEWNTAWWWLGGALAGAVLTFLLAKAAPVLLMPLFYRFRPLERRELTARLVELSNRAGVPVLGVFEWGLGAKTRRANAALVGSGGTRRILLSDTLLAEYTDDEIEVILAHELAHHVHGDIRKGIAIEFVLLLVSLFVASIALDVFAGPLGLRGPADPAGLPVVLLAAGAVMLASTPFLNAFSRHNERRADEFALALTRRREAFVSAMRRLGAQNLSEESPSRATVWLFHTHPPIEERIAAARSAAP